MDQSSRHGEGSGHDRRHTRRARQARVPRHRGDVTTALVQRAQRGDHDAFDALIRPRYHGLYGVAARILRDPHAAEDAVQDALVIAWRDLRGLRDPERLDAWLQRLVVNGCRDGLRRVRRRPVEVAVLVVDHPTRDDTESFVRRDELERAFERLSVDHRAVLVLTHYAGYSAPEVAAILGIPVGTVYSRLHNAAAAMRRALAPASPPPGQPMEATR